MMYPMVRMSDGVHIRVFPGERALLLARGVARDDVMAEPHTDSTQPTPPRKQARKRTPRTPKAQSH